MTGRTLAHYQIVEKLGEGGMGVVWKARDTHLDRFVALKLLPAEKLSDPERKRRFVQEAKSASALNHPNIIHIYDISDAEGVPFLAMEYVAGKTLGVLIGRNGLRLQDALKYAIQIVDALARAIPPESSTGTLSPPTSWSPTAGSSKCWTSASRNWPNRVQLMSLPLPGHCARKRHKPKRA
jgi:serine/threonine protein kinase